jgi:hypothetical protein
VPDLVQVTSPSGVKVTVAKDAAEAFTGLLADLEKSGYKIAQSETGGFNDRNIAGTNTPSQHSFGHAVDINWQHNPRGAQGPSDLPPNVGDIAAAHGLTWGGNWSGDTRDPMHFELSGKPVAVASNDDLLARMNKVAPAVAPPPVASASSTPGQTSSASAQAAPSDDELLRRMGTVAAPPPTAAEQKTVRAPDNRAGPYSEYGDLAAQPWAQGTPPAADSVAPVAKAFSSGQGMRNALVAPPGYVRTPIPFLPLAFKETAPGSGEIDPSSGLSGLKFDPGAAIAPFATPLLDLLEGTGLETSMGGQNAPLAGKVSPAATALLAGVMAGNPVRQFRNPLEAPSPGLLTSGDRQLGAPEVRTPSAGDLRAAPLPADFKANPLSSEGRAAVESGRAPEAPSTPTGIATGKPPPEIPATTAGVAEGEPHKAWVGDTVGQIKSLVEENAAAGGPKDLSAAATPAELAAMSPQMAKAYRRMAEVNRVVSPIEGEDTSTMVPGSIPTEAEAKGDPVTSQKEVMTRQRRPEVYEGPQGRLTQNDAARARLYDDQTLSDPQIETLNEDQAKQARKDTATVIAKAGPVDAAPEAARLKRVLADPRIKEQPDIVKVLQPIHDALYDADGNLKTDIQSFWGMHDNLMNKLAKAKDPLQASSSEKFAFNQILDAKNAVDELMNKASGGAFQTFLDNQSEFFKSKNAATILRDFRPKMINQKTGAIDANRFHRFVTDLAVRRGKPGIDPAMDIPDEVMGNLMNIDDDLKRAGRIDLGKPRGSPTNLYFELAKGLGIAGAHSLAAGLGPVGNVGVQIGVGALQRMSANMRLNKLVDQSLNYPPGRDPRITPSPNPPGRFVPPAQRNPLTPP